MFKAFTLKPMSIFVKKLLLLPIALTLNKYVYHKYMKKTLMKLSISLFVNSLK